MNTAEVDVLYKVNQTCDSGVSDVVQISVIFVIMDLSVVRTLSYIRPLCEYFHPLLRYPDYYLTTFNFVYYYCHFSKMITTTTMSINRFTAVNHPVKHRMVWRNHISKIIACLLILPFLFTWPIAATKTYLFMGGGQAQILYVHLFPWARTTFFKIIIGVPALIFIICSNIRAVSTLKKIGKNMKSVETTMTVSTIFVSTGFVIFLFLQVSFLVMSYQFLADSPLATSVLMTAQQLSNDFFMLSGPVVLLILDKRIRRSIVRCRSNGKQNSKLVSSPQPTQTNVF